MLAIEALLAEGAEPNAVNLQDKKDSHGYAALHWACLGDHAGAAAALLRGGANVRQAAARGARVQVCYSITTRTAHCYTA